MKVTIVQGPFLPVPPVLGGAVEKLWTRLGIEFARAGLEVTHISRSMDGQLPREVDRGVTRIRVNGYDRPAKQWRGKVMDLLYSLEVMKNLPDADILVTNTFFLPFLPIPKRKGKIYVSVHRFPQWQYALYPRASRLQCVSSTVSSELIRQLPSARDRVRVISNFVEEAVQEKGEFADSASYKDRRMLFVGRIHPEKGLELLLKSFSRSKLGQSGQWKLRVVGPHEIALGGGGEDYFSRLKQLATELGLSVEWCAAEYSVEGLASHYLASDIFVYPSLAKMGEAFPLAPLEAMAYGLPTVVSDLDCFDEFVSAGQNGWQFPIEVPDPVESLSNTLLIAGAEVEARGSRLAAMAKQTARRFTPEAIAAQFIEDFHSLAAV